MSKKTHAQKLRRAATEFTYQNGKPIVTEFDIFPGEIASNMSIKLRDEIAGKRITAFGHGIKAKSIKSNRRIH